VTSKGEAAWLEEEEAYSLSNDAFGQIALSAYKVGTAIKISEELLNDSVFDLPAYIAKEFGRKIGAKEEEAFLTGDGKGKRTGIFSDIGGAENEETTRQVMLYTISYLYENRNTADFLKLTLVIRALLFAQREDVI
jgi:HK97 family phage major capsid protein